MHAELEDVRVLRFDDGSPVRAASAVTEHGDGWLVAQDDAVHGAWWRPDGVRRVRLLPPREGHDVFASADGTKHLKPDLEAACPVPGGVLLLGSGSAPRRTDAVLVRDEDVVHADVAPLHRRVAQALGADAVNLEGACVLGPVLRWFARGSRTQPSASVDVDLAALLAAVTGDGPLDAVTVGAVRTYALGDVDGVPLAVTDAVALPDGRVLASAAAEDTDDPVDDGPVGGSALALLDDDDVLAVAPVPALEGQALKVEGLAVVGTARHPLRVLAVVDDDDATAASRALRLRLHR